MENLFKPFSQKLIQLADEKMAALNQVAEIFDDD